MPVTSPDRRPVRALLFDLDDTLIDRVDALTRLNRHWYRTLPSDHRPDCEDEFVARMLSQADRFSSPRQLYELMIKVWPGSFADPDTALESHNAAMPKMVRLADSTLIMLKVLREHGVPVGVVTNGETQMQWAKVRNAGVDGLVDAVVVSEKFGARKPDSSIFEHALGLIGADVSETLFVGDNPVADIGGAHGVGMHTAWLHHGRNWSEEDYRPDHQVDAVWEAPRLLGS